MNSTFDEIWQSLMSANSILIPLHLSPDPDSLGSAVASALILKEHGKEVRIVSADPKIDLPLLNNMFRVEELDPADVDQSTYDLFLAQDISGLDRFSKSEDFSLDDDITIINLDHHPTNSRFGTCNYVDSTVSSTAELLYQLYSSQKVTITEDAATALYYGLVADAGWFAFGPQPSTYDAAKALAELGADPRCIKTDMERTTFENVRITGKLYERFEKVDEGNFAFSYLTLQDIEDCGLTGKAFYAGSHITKFLPKVDFGAVATELEGGMFKVSMRTREAHDFSVADLAQKLGGGGHPMAAGCRIEADNAEQVKAKILEALASA